MLFFLCMDYVGGVNMSLRTANTYDLARRAIRQDLERSSGNSHRIRQSRNDVRQSNGRLGRCSTSITSAATSNASMVSGEVVVPIFTT